MKHTRLAIGMAIIGATTASLIGLVPASATVRSSTLTAAHMPAPALVHAAALPRGLRPALRPTAGKPRSGRIRPLDSVACYDGDSILSAANGRWVSAELGYTGGNYAMLRARATAIGPWEQYYTLTGRVGC
jgi:hypothetical protein